MTTSGGYSNPSQANDGTIFAVKGDLIHRMSRSGRLLNLAGDPSGSGPLVASAAPGGSLVAYHFNNTGSITPGLRTALSHADAARRATTSSSTSAAGSTRPGSATARC